jgi:hypothetical protein
MQRILTYVVIAALGASAYWLYDTYVTAARWQEEGIAAWLDGRTAIWQSWWTESTRDIALSVWWGSANNILSVATAVAGIAGKVLWRRKENNV